MMQIAELPLRCPCCRCATLAQRGAFEICPVCFWEDDGQDDHDIDWVRGGANGDLSLRQAQANYRCIGACRQSDRPHVRAPLAHERLDPSM